MRLATIRFISFPNNSRFSELSDAIDHHKSRNTNSYDLSVVQQTLKNETNRLVGESIASYCLAASGYLLVSPSTTSAVYATGVALCVGNGMWATWKNNKIHRASTLLFDKD